MKGCRIIQARRTHRPFPDQKSPCFPTRLMDSYLLVLQLVLHLMKHPALRAFSFRKDLTSVWSSQGTQDFSQFLALSPRVQHSCDTKPLPDMLYGMSIFFLSTRCIAPSQKEKKERGIGISKRLRKSFCCPLKLHPFYFKPQVL